VIHVFLDNLAVHRSRKDRAFAGASNIVLVFSAANSQEYNPIEWFWVLAKQIFKSKLDGTNNLSPVSVYLHIKEAVASIPPEPLGNHVRRLVNRMRYYLELESMN
jgi:transposase